MIKLIISIVAVGAFCLYGQPAQAFVESPLISRVETHSSNKTHVTLCWTIVDTLPTAPAITYWKTDAPSEKTTKQYQTQIPLSNNVCENVYPLEENTSYSFQIKYRVFEPNTETVHGTPLTWFSDYDADEEMIISPTYVLRTANRTAEISNFSTTYVMAGETIRVYGKNLGTGPSSLTGHVARLGSGNYEQKIYQDNEYQFPIIHWTNSYIDLQVPSYDAAKTPQSGKLYFDDLIFEATHYPAGLFVTMISTASAMERPLGSGYQGNAYRYLVNATRYRFNQSRTYAKFLNEQSRMRWIADYLHGIGKGVDATWSLVLSYGLVYGGYTEDEIKHEIKSGPGCIHATIPASAWRSTSGYAACMAHSL